MSQNKPVTTCSFLAAGVRPFEHELPFCFGHNCLAETRGGDVFMPKSRMTCSSITPR